MALIDEEIVRMKFENGGFNEDVEQSEQAIESLDQTLENLSDNKSLEDLGDQTEEVSIKFDALRVAVETAVYRIVNSVIDGISIIKSKLDSVTIDPIMQGYGKYEEKINAVQTIMNATGLTIDQVEEKLEKLSWFTDETSYKYSDMVGSLSKFTSAGVGLDDAVTAMMGIADWAGTAGVNAQNATRAYYQLSQAIGSGSIRLQDWASIESLNMNNVEAMQTFVDVAKEFVGYGEMYSDIIDQFGQNSEAFNKAVKDNGHTVEQAMKYVDYFTSGVKPKDVAWEDFTTLGFRDTLSGGWFTSDVFLEAMRRYGDFSEQLKKFQDENGFDTASEALHNYNDAFSDLIDKLYDTYTEFGQNSKEFKAVLEENNLGLQTALDFVSVKEARVFNEKLEELAESLKKTADEFGFESKEFAKAANDAGYSVQDAADMVTNGIEKFQKAERSLGQKGFEASYEARTFSDAWGAAIEGVSSQWSRFWENIIGDYEEAKDIWTKVSEVLWDVFAGPISDINDTIEAVINAGGRLNIIEGIKNVWTVLESVITPIKEALGDVFEFFSPDEDGNYKNAAEYIYAITEAFRRWSETLGAFRGRFYEIKSIATTVFSTLKMVVDIVGNIISNLGRIIKAVLPNFGNLFTLISQIFSNIGGFEEIANSINSAVTDFTNKIIFRILQIKVVVLVVLAAIVEKIRDTFDTIKVMFLIFMGEYEKALETNSDAVNKMHQNGVYKKILKLREVFDKASEAFTVFSEKIQNKVLPIIEKVKQKIPEAIEKIITVVADVGSIGWFIFDILSSIAVSAAELFGVLVLGPAEAAEGLTPLNTIAAILQGLAPIIDAVIGMIKNLIIGIGEFVKNINIWKAAGLLLIEGLINGSISIKKVFEDVTWDLSKFLKGLGVPVEGIKNIYGGIKEAIKGMFEAFAETSWLEATADMIRSFAWSLLILAGAALILSTLPADKLASSFATITGFIVEFGAVLQGLIHTIKTMQGANVISYIPFLNIPITPITTVTLAIIGFASAIFILSAAVLNLGKAFDKYGPEAFGAAIGSLTVGMYGMVTAIASLLYIISYTMKGMTATKVAAELIGIANLLGSFAVAFLLMSVAVKVLSSSDPLAIAQGLLSIGALLLEIMIFCKYIQLGTTVGQLVGIAGAMILFALAINMLVIPIELIGHMKPEQQAQGLLAIAFMLLEFVGTLWLLKKLEWKIPTEYIIKVAFSMMIFAAAIDMMTGAIAVLGNMKLEQVGQGLFGIGVMLVFFLGTVEALAKANLANGRLHVIKLATSFLILAVAIDLFTIGIKTLGEMDPWDMLHGLEGVAAMLAMIGVFVWAINTVIGGIPGQMIKLSLGILAISAAIGVLTLSLLSIAKLTPEQQMNGLIGILGLFTEVALFLLAIKAIDPVGFEFIKISVGLIALSVGIMLMAQALKMMTEISLLEIGAGLLKIALILAAIAIVSALLSGAAPAMISFGISVGVVGAGLYLLGIGIDAMHTAIENIVNDPNVQKLATDIIAGIQTALEQLQPLMDLVKEAWTDMWDEITEGWKNFWDYINGDTDQLGNPEEYSQYGLNNTVPPELRSTGTKGSFDELVREEYYKTGQNGAEGFQDGVDSVDLTILPEELRPENKGNFDELVYAETFKTGENLSQGLKDGAQSVDLSILPQEATSTVLNGYTGKSGFDEHSPSKKTHKIGEYVTLGLAEGIKDKQANKELLLSVDEMTGDAKDRIKDNVTDIDSINKEIDDIIDEVEKEAAENNDFDFKQNLIDSLLGGIDDSKLLNDDQKKWLKDKATGIIDGLNLDGITGDKFKEIKDQIKGIINFDDLEIPQIENPFDTGGKDGEGWKLPEIELPDTSGLDLDFSNLTNTTNGLSNSLSNLNTNLADTKSLTGDISNITDGTSLADLFGDKLTTKAEAEGYAIGEGITTGITDATRKLSYNDIIHRNNIIRAAQKDGIWSDAFNKAITAAGYTDKYYSQADRLQILNNARKTRVDNFNNRINIANSQKIKQLLDILNEHGVTSEEFEKGLKAYYGSDYKQMTTTEKYDLVAALTEAYAKEEQFIRNNYSDILRAYQNGSGSASFKEFFDTKGASDYDIANMIDRVKAQQIQGEEQLAETQTIANGIGLVTDVFKTLDRFKGQNGIKVEMFDTDELKAAIGVIESSVQKGGVSKTSTEYLNALNTLGWGFETAEYYLKLKEEEKKEATGQTTATTKQITATSSTSETAANKTSTYNPVTTVKADNVTVDSKTASTTAQTTTENVSGLSEYVKKGVDKLVSIDASMTAMNTKIDTLANTVSMMYMTDLNSLAMFEAWRAENNQMTATIGQNVAGIQNNGVTIRNRASFMNEVAESVDSTLGNKAMRRARG